MNNLDCYFFVDASVSEKDQKMSVLCTSCRDEKMPETGWFYKGSVEGYGPFTYKCCLCELVIHSADQGINGKEEIKTTS